MSVHIDTFTSLDGLPRKHHGSPEHVLAAIMSAGGRFSVFDATETPRIARTMDYILTRSGWVENTGAKDTFPWTTIELTDAGRAALAAHTGGRDQ